MHHAVASHIVNQPTATDARRDRRYLNAADRLMLVGHESLRDLGHGGFQCQTHVWLRRRVDVDALRDALGRLNRRHPVVTARLDDAGRKETAFWRYRPEADVELEETTLDQSDPAAVWRHPERLFMTPMDLDRHDPVSFHLLHLPDGRDVFVIRFCHALMDGKAPEFVLKEIDDCFAPQEEAWAEAPGGGVASHEALQSGEDGDEISAHLDRFDRKRRIRAALRVVRSHVRLPVRSLTLDPPGPAGWLYEPYRIAVRSLDGPQTRIILERAKRLCGFANLSPLVLASVFRAVSRLTPRKQTGRTWFQTDVPLNLRLPGRAEPIFRNFMSFIQMSARGAELHDRDALARAMNARMRDQLRRGIDLGNLQMMALMSRHLWLLRRHVLERAKRHPFTLGFGYQGPVVKGLESFCGRPVDWIYTLNSALSPPGITLQVNQFRGRLNLALTYISSGVPETLANEFLDTIMSDLLDQER